MLIHNVDLKSKKVRRQRRSLRLKARSRKQSLPVLNVHKTGQHIYAQVVTSDGARVLCTASTLTAAVRPHIKRGGNKQAAIAVGKEIATRCLSSEITNIVFNRNGFPYHGRVKALAEAARENGLQF